MIYFGGRYSCSVAGSVWKEVRCEGCQCEYLYLLSRTWRGSGSSPYYIDNEGAQRRAEQAAVKNLPRRLDSDAAPGSCLNPIEFRNRTKHALVQTIRGTGAERGPRKPFASDHGIRLILRCWVLIVAVFTLILVTGKTTTAA